MAVARGLLGQQLVHVIDGQRCAGIIVETEAYLGVPDKAAHSFGWRRTARTASMFADGGTAYVFMTYGMHFLLNVVVAQTHVPQAVLIRAIEPTEGLDVMRKRRNGVAADRDLCNGPAKLAQALSIDRSHDGLDLTTHAELWIEQARRTPLPWPEVALGPRVGVDYAEDWAEAPLRFCVLGNPHVSRAGPRYNRCLVPVPAPGSPGSGMGSFGRTSVPVILLPWLKRSR